MIDNTHNEEQQDDVLADESVDTDPNPHHNEDTETDEIDTGDSTPEAAIEKCKQKLKACQKERQEYMDGWQRAQADYLNLKKELDQEKTRAKENAKVDTLASILPALDSFEMAFANKEAWEAVDKNWRVGIENIYAQLIDALEGCGITQDNPLGEAFDPHIHDSIESVETENPAQENTVAEVIQKGYRTKETVIRPAKVRVYHATDTNDTHN